MEGSFGFRADMWKGPLNPEQPTLRLLRVLVQYYGVMILMMTMILIRTVVLKHEPQHVFQSYQPVALTK